MRVPTDQKVGGSSPSERAQLRSPLPLGGGFLANGFANTSGARRRGASSQRPADSTAEQPARPLIDVLGMELPSCDIQISAVQLVIQHGPERLWDWIVISTIPMQLPGEPGHRSRGRPHGQRTPRELTARATRTIAPVIRQQMCDACLPPP